jgi:hypothetical protein
MKKFLIACVFLLSISCGINKQVILSIDDYVQQVIPDYEAYIDSDPSLLEKSKEAKIHTIKMFQTLMDSIKKANNIK